MTSRCSYHIYYLITWIVNTMKCSLIKFLFTFVFVQRHSEKGCTNLCNNAQQRATTCNKGFNIDKFWKQKYFWDPWAIPISENIRKKIFMIKHVCSCPKWNWAVLPCATMRNKGVSIDKFQNQNYFWDPWTKPFSENIRKKVFIIKHVCSCLKWN